jgi:hypothetical protein
LCSALTVLPRNVYAQRAGRLMPRGDIGGRSISASYEEAVKDCEAKVALIVADCRRNNKKYTDPYFDLDQSEYCLQPYQRSLERLPPPMISLKTIPLPTVSRKKPFRQEGLSAGETYSQNRNSKQHLLTIFLGVPKESETSSTIQSFTLIATQT